MKLGLVLGVTYPFKFKIISDFLPSVSLSPQCLLPPFPQSQVSPSSLPLTTHEFFLWKQLCFHHTSLILILSQLNSFSHNFHFCFYCSYTVILKKIYMLAFTWEGRGSTRPRSHMRLWWAGTVTTQRVTQAQWNERENGRQSHIGFCWEEKCNVCQVEKGST